ncbi:MAG: hypothetical protein EU532_07560 [Promethearchaeota archaeon]|nr:MAG: hypothetical protein EU532_07560 [Candidatus Lokiarchaeota archaeon]
MPKCNYCGEDAGFLPFKCKFCGMTFCKKHRLPENHNCPFDLLSTGEKTIDSYILYQDALETITEELTVDKIYYYVQSKQLNKKEAVGLLKTFFENSEDMEVRKICLMAIKLLDLKTKEAYNLLENSLLSDENAEVRRVAARVLLSKFPLKSKDVLKWAREHDKTLK